MGDHRMTIRIHFKMHGHEADSGEMWINGSSDQAIPHIVEEWFEAQHSMAMFLYEEELNKKSEEQFKEIIENAERQELARLKAKYEGEEVHG